MDIRRPSTDVGEDPWLTGAIEQSMIRYTLYVAPLCRCRTPLSHRAAVSNALQGSFPLSRIIGRAGRKAHGVGNSGMAAGGRRAPAERVQERRGTAVRRRVHDKALVEIRGCLRDWDDGRDAAREAKAVAETIIAPEYEGRVLIELLPQPVPGGLR